MSNIAKIASTFSLTPTVGPTLILGRAILFAILVFLLKFLLTKRQSSKTQEPFGVPAKQAEYVTTFPPSQRSALRDILRNASCVSGTDDPTVLARNVLDLNAHYRSADPSKLIFTGFSVGEIRALGNFPDYAKLSGVPLPTPVFDFDLKKALPRPYRPFRWAYHQTMSLKRLEPDYWIEIENKYAKRIKQRQEIYAKHGKDVLNALSGSELACKEIMEMALQFVCARYPRQFELVDGNRTLVNHILNTRDDLAKKDPLLVLLDNIPEDFCMMLRDPTTGMYCFRAGIICSSVGWYLGDKMGLGMPAIHKTVPDYKEKMEFSMDRFFTQMPTDKPIQRGSWAFEIGEPLYLPPHDPEFNNRNHQEQSLRPEDISLRVDWQTLRRLPLSGAVVFNFKALFTPITEFRNERYVPSLILKVLSEGNEAILKYKSTWHVEHVIKPTLVEYERYQKENGLMNKNWEPETLAESPFFPGWEDKWKLSTAHVDASIF
ncbi:uncharacterized protein N7483_007439 [Penicillium malachiteum]|uniref:uncharacterized protein n=1 Tax=Penicillium malachiteum TaxID=1324776 RepID=UPI002547C5BC|nr:uncharacterized protein N7483_007439 [Penicillium malachiteum]KAJ5726082.1 hypothetical protein N7483_007439 [Penicillium malachiteum]